MTGVALKLLEKIICAFAAQEPARFNIVNNVGGYPIHALMICNTDESLDLALRLMQRRAEWLILPYANSPPLHLFTGETILHVKRWRGGELAYEDRTKAGEELEEKEKPVDYITRKQLETFLRSAATGNFFTSEPVQWFGGTALGFACSFNMKKAVTALLGVGDSGKIGDVSILSLNRIGG